MKVTTGNNLFLNAFTIKHAYAHMCLCTRMCVCVEIFSFFIFVSVYIYMLRCLCELEGIENIRVRHTFRWFSREFDKYGCKCVCMCKFSKYLKTFLWFHLIQHFTSLQRFESFQLILQQKIYKTYSTYLYNYFMGVDMPWTMYVCMYIWMYLCWRKGVKLRELVFSVQQIFSP